MNKTKLLIIICFSVLFGLLSQSQTPVGISYQAIVRNEKNELHVKKMVGVRISILKDGSDGTVVYAEKHDTETNLNGLMTLIIGQGNPVNNSSIESIDWASGNYFVKTEIDLNGGNNYHISGTSQLLSVPYALYAETAGNAFDGDYSKLTNLPSFADVAISGDYNDLDNTPEFPELSVVAVSGDYNDLENLPVIPAIPELSTVATSGNYKDLTNQPSIRDSINMYGFNGNYNDLSNLPILKDSVDYYGFSGSWNDLIDKPNLEDGGFSGDYLDLINQPSFLDSIVKYGFNGNYKDLLNLPSFRDSIAEYGFSGDYYELSRTPMGKSKGDILYWDGSSDWNVLTMGTEGQILSIQNGALTWIDNIGALTYNVGDFFLDTNNNPLGIVVEISESGGYGKIISLVEFDVTWDPLATEAAMELGYTGTLPELIGADSNSDGESNTNKIMKILDYETKYPAIGKVASLGTGWYLPSADELKNLIYKKKTTINQALDDLGENKLEDANYWSSTEEDAFKAKQVAFKAYTTSEENILEGEILDMLKSTTGKVRAMKYLTSEEINSRPSDYKVYKIGDIYYEDNEPVGIVYEIQNGGLNGKVVSIEEDYFFWSYLTDFVGATNTMNGQLNFDTIIEYYKNNEEVSINKEYGIFWTQSTIGDGWYLPASEELKDIYAKRDIINTSIGKLSGVNNNATELKNTSIDFYWSSTEVDDKNAVVISFENGNESDMEKSSNAYFRGVRIF